MKTSIVGTFSNVEKIHLRRFQLIYRFPFFEVSKTKN